MSAEHIALLLPQQPGSPSPPQLGGAAAAAADAQHHGVQHHHQHHHHSRLWYPTAIAAALAVNVLLLFGLVAHLVSFTSSAAAPLSGGGGGAAAALHLFGAAPSPRSVQAPLGSSAHAAWCAPPRVAVIVLAEQRNNNSNSNNTGSAAQRPRTARDVAPELLWASLANKRAYTDLHGYALYVVPAPLQTLRPAASWDKIAALQAVFAAHPEHEWVWVLDLDAFVLNLDSGVEHIIALADHQRRAHGQGIELIIARDCNGINAGSMLLRRSAWTSHLLERMWSDEWRNVPDVEIWWEQAVLMHLHATDADVRERTLFVPQRTLNAYPTGTRCGEGYVDGDLVVHMPDTMKREMAKYMCRSSLYATPPSAPGCDGAPTPLQHLVRGRSGGGAGAAGPTAYVPDSSRALCAAAPLPAAILVAGSEVAGGGSSDDDDDGDDDEGIRVVDGSVGHSNNALPVRWSVMPIAHASIGGACNAGWPLPAPSGGDWPPPGVCA